MLNGGWRCLLITLFHVPFSPVCNRQGVEILMGLSPKFTILMGIYKFNRMSKNYAHLLFFKTRFSMNKKLQSVFKNTHLPNLHRTNWKKAHSFSLFSSKWYDPYIKQYQSWKKILSCNTWKRRYRKKNSVPNFRARMVRVAKYIRFFLNVPGYSTSLFSINPLE